MSYNGTGYDFVPAPVSDINELIQPGAAFFVDAKGAGTLNIRESHKTCNSTSPFAYRTADQASRIKINLHSLNSDGTKPVVDAVMSSWFESFSDGLDDMDASKLPINSHENLSIRTSGGLYSIERRSQIKHQDSILLNLNFMKVKNYELQIECSGMDTLLIAAILEDLQTGTQYPLNLGSVNRIGFSIAAGFNPNRFRIIFSKINLGVLPVKFNQIQVQKTASNQGLLTWSVENEQQVVRYEIQKSTNGLEFEKAAVQLPQNQVRSSGYQWTDLLLSEGYNYYRILVVEQNGSSYFSKVVLLNNSAKSNMTIYPNPVANHEMHLRVSGLTSNQTAQLLLHNQNGQLIYSQVLQLTAGNSNLAIALPTHIQRGAYQVLIYNENLKQTIPVIIE